jgi:hypothetical protein
MVNKAFLYRWLYHPVFRKYPPLSKLRDFLINQNYRTFLYLFAKMRALNALSKTAITLLGQRAKPIASWILIELIDDFSIMNEVMRKKIKQESDLRQYK